jgi:hypothetical protein
VNWLTALTTVLGLFFLIIGIGAWRNASSFTKAPFWWRPLLWQMGILYGPEARKKAEQRLVSPSRIRVDAIAWIVFGGFLLGANVVYWLIKLLGVGG